MSFEGHVHDMTQKYRLAIAISVLKSKPNNLSIEQYIEKLKNKYQNTEMEAEEFDISIPSDDFNLDEEEIEAINDAFSHSFDENEPSDANMAETIESQTILVDFGTKRTELNLRNEENNSFSQVMQTLRDIDETADVQTFDPSQNNYYYEDTQLFDYPTTNIYTGNTTIGTQSHYKKVNDCLKVDLTCKYSDKAIFTAETTSQKADLISKDSDENALTREGTLINSKKAKNDSKMTLKVIESSTNTKLDTNNNTDQIDTQANELTHNFTHISQSQYDDLNIPHRHLFGNQKVTDKGQKVTDKVQKVTEKSQIVTDKSENINKNINVSKNNNNYHCNEDLNKHIKNNEKYNKETHKINDETDQDIVNLDDSMELTLTADKNNRKIDKVNDQKDLDTVGTLDVAMELTEDTFENFVSDDTMFMGIPSNNQNHLTEIDGLQSTQDIFNFETQDIDDDDGEFVQPLQREDTMFMGPEEPSMFTGREEPSMFTGREERSMFTGREEPSIFTGREEPSMFTGREEPSMFTGREEPSMFTGREEPSMFTGREEPSIFTGREEPSIFTGREEPSMFTGREEPSIFTGREEPSIFTGREEPSIFTGREEPSMFTGREEPSMFTGREEPSMFTGREERSMFTGREEPSMFTGREEPSMFTGREEPSMFTGREEPSMFTGREERSMFTGREEPSIFTGREEPSMFTGREEPSMFTGREERSMFTGREEPSMFTGREEPSIFTGREERSMFTGREEPSMCTGPEEPNMFLGPETSSKHQNRETNTNYTQLKYTPKYTQVVKINSNITLNKIDSSQISYIIDNNGKMYRIVHEQEQNIPQNILESIKTSENIQAYRIPQNMQKGDTSQNTQEHRSISQNIQDRNIISQKTQNIQENRNATSQNTREDRKVISQITQENRNMLQNTQPDKNISQNTQEISQNTQETSQNTQETQYDDNIEQDLTNSQIEAVSFKVLEEFNRIKTLLKKSDRKITDSSQSDSGYKSDSQKSVVNSSQSTNWVNQSAHSLFNYLLDCQLIHSTEKITGEISQVLARLIDRLHEEEHYPSFLAAILESIDKMVADLTDGENYADHVLVKKDETIQRLCLLNKSVHIIKYTIEKITQKLEIIHTKLTTEKMYEMANIDKCENLCYIFHVLEILLQRYIKVKDILTQESVHSEDEKEKLLKKSSITDIWRKKWIPNYKVNVSNVCMEKQCILIKCSEVLNKIIVGCMEGYSLVSFSALQCFNMMQK